MNEERELKLRPTDAALLDRLEGLGELGPYRVVGRRNEVQHNTYFDTPGRSLVGARLSFRRRVLDGERLAIWTVKGGGQTVAGVATRPEIEARLDPDLPPIMALGVLRQAARERGAPVLAERVADALEAGGRPRLEPLVDLSMDRRILDLEGGPPLARVELALDRTHFPNQTSDDLEIEAELKNGDEAALRVIQDAIQAFGDAPPSAGSKLRRALAWLDAQPHA